MNENDNPNQRSLLLRFFGNPIVGILGSIASIIGIVLSIYFFLLSREVPELTYIAHPARAAVVRPGEISRLAVQFDGQQLASDVTAVQVAFWNAGRKPIRASDVLSPLIIRTGNGERILEAKLRKTSREVVKITLDSSESSAGAVKLDWKVLEQNDGGVVQIIYVGDEAVGVQAEAVLEGQPQIHGLDYSGEFLTPGEQYEIQRSSIGKQFGSVIIFAGVITIAIVLLIQQRKLLKIERPIRWMMIAQGLALIALGVYAFFFTGLPGPPFRF